MIYLDNAATTKPDRLVVKSMLPYYTSDYGNPGSVHSCGRSANTAMQRARRHIADFLRCNPQQLIFTSGGSEANSLVFHGLSGYLKRIGKTHVIISAIEHDSVMNAALSLIAQDFTISILPVGRNGEVSEGDLEKLITPQTGLVSVMFVNNETGAVQPVAQLADICHKNGALFHTDCVQAASAFGLDVNRIRCDFLSLSSHKLHGPKGVGALFARDCSLLLPIIYGGNDQEHGLRGGTENVPAIIGFGAACDLLWCDTGSINPMRITQLASTFYDELSDAMQEHGFGELLHLNGELGEGRRLSRKILNIRIDGADSETLLMMLDANGVCVSAGSACRSHESEPSRVLLAMGLTEEQARNSFRVSFSKFNTEEEVRAAASIISNCVKELCRMEPEE